MNYSEISPQDIVNMIWARLNDGKGRAYDGNLCSYKTEDGNKCAVGIFLPENSYIQGFHGGLGDFVFRYEEYHGEDWYKFLYRNLRLLSDMQEIHDSKSNWIGNQFHGVHFFRAVCEKYNLEFPGDVK